MSARKNWLSWEVTAGVEPPPITLINVEQEEVKKESDYFKLKILGDPASATSKTYELKLALFGKDEPEEFHLFNF